jgi:hydroxymethylpyrimidine/phosphomethylpyrimidine kinase
MNGITHEPVQVLVIAGHDPAGGAGVQADIEAINRCGGRCATLITAMTAQNTREFAALFPAPVKEFRQAAELLLDDMRFSACKIGLLGSVEIAAYVAEVLARVPVGPVVMDPVLASGTGGDLAGSALIDAMKRSLFPRTNLLTPNVDEALRLSGRQDVDDAARALLDFGIGNILVTGGDAPTRVVVNRLYCADGASIEFESPRLPNRYHGSGCTLAAAISALLARGDTLETAVRLGLEFTWSALDAARNPGRGQWIPDRVKANKPPQQE